MNLFEKVLASTQVCKNRLIVFFSFIGGLATMPVQSLAVTQPAVRTVLNTQYGTANGIDDLPGVDPSAAICTTGRPDADPNKVFYFYNEGARRFLSIGGLWGTHASINNTPNAIWFEATGTTGQYYLNNRIDGSGTGTYVGISNTNLNMDRARGTGVFTFVKADGYSEKNKVYRMIVNRTNYVTTFPGNPNLLCNVAPSYASTDANYKNQVWKIISKQEYYTLALANPATMEALLDFSFLMPDPDFRINNTDAVSWKLGSFEKMTNIPIYLGDATMHCTFSKRGESGASHFNKYDEKRQQVYGKYAYCYSKQLRNFYLYQEVKVHKAGWYVVRCNGFSTQQAIEGESKPLASLFVAQYSLDSTKVKSGAQQAPDTIAIDTSASTLNAVSAAEAQTMENSSDGAGIGVAFFDGKYENQVQLCVEVGADGKNPVSQEI